MTNEDKYNKYKLKQLLRYLTILLNLAVIFLEALALFKVISYLWGFIPFFLNIIVKYFYEIKLNNNKEEKVKKKKKNKEKNIKNN